MVGTTGVVWLVRHWLTPLLEVDVPLGGATAEGPLMSGPSTPRGKWSSELFWVAGGQAAFAATYAAPTVHIHFSFPFALPGVPEDARFLN